MLVQYSPFIDRESYRDLRDCVKMLGTTFTNRGVTSIAGWRPAARSSLMSSRTVGPTEPKAAKAASRGRHQCSWLALLASLDCAMTALRLNCRAAKVRVDWRSTSISSKSQLATRTL